jgi:hypothetical protein
MDNEDARPFLSATTARRAAVTVRYLQNRTVDWLDHQLAARELLQLDVANTHLVIEHEYPKARIQDRDRLKPILQGSQRSCASNRRERERRGAPSL